MVLTYNNSTTYMGYGWQALQNGVNIAVGNNGVQSGLAVTQRGAGANMSVDVALGIWTAAGTLNQTTGVTNVVISAAPSSGNTRIDLISAKSDGTINVTAGTVATTGTELVPSIPASSVPLAIVAVPSGTSSISNSGITDVSLPCSRGLKLIAYNDTSTQVAAAGVIKTLTIPANTINNFMFVICDFQTVGATVDMTMEWAANGSNTRINNEGYGATKNGTMFGFIFYYGASTWFSHVLNVAVGGSETNAVHYGASATDTRTTSRTLTISALGAAITTVTNGKIYVFTDG